jgi:uncharacterized protein YndB with AHSA1/START domain
MTRSLTLSVESRGDREIVLTRAFSAPRRLVFEALTRPELLKRWFGVFGEWTLPVCEIDLRVGGSYRYVWRGPDGATMGLSGVYREIVPPERIVATELFDEAWYPGEALDTMVLTEHGGLTTLTITVLYQSPEARDGVLASNMEHGVAAGYNNLETVLAELQARETTDGRYC